MILLTSRVATERNLSAAHFLQWKFPAIAFVTQEATRRSMTLNGLRMSTEYFASGSPRVLLFIEQRLQDDQADVVHDVLVYLMQRILQWRTLMEEERALQAESLAAYLGLDASRVQELLFDWPVQISQMSGKIEAGFAGTPRRVVNLASLLENQLLRFSAATQELKDQEDRVLRLIDEVVSRLYNHDLSDC